MPGNGLAKKDPMFHHPRSRMANEFVQKINRESVRICLEGWIRGDANTIISQADRKRFTCTWVPTGDIYTFDQFPAFYNQLKVDAEQVGIFNENFSACVGGGKNTGQNKGNLSHTNNPPKWQE